MTTAGTIHDADQEQAVSPIAKRKPTTFAGDVLKLVSGTTFAQALGILVTPLLTRLYSPEAFGTLAVMLLADWMLPFVHSSAASASQSPLRKCLRSVSVAPTAWAGRGRILGF